STGDCVQCVADNDCPVGDVCRNNACDDGGGGGNPGCTSQAQCDPYGLVCNLASGECEACSTALPCPAGKYCEANGRCSECLNDGHCDPGYVCSGGTCIADGGGGGDGTCVFRDDCDGYACLLGYCVPCFFDEMCFDFMDIFTGETKICDLSTGMCIDPECASAYDCPPTLGCYAGHCGPCFDDSECRGGEVCNTATGECGTGGGGGCLSNNDCFGGLVCVGDACVECTSDTQCNPGQTCSGGRCGGSGDLGAPCTTHNDCDAGFICLGNGSTSICTRTCIGSGKGGDADCPLGYACQNFESGPLDGLIMCNAATQLSSTYPGQPFDMAPGASCSSRNGCQTSVCYTSGCARQCAANRDCAASEVCYALPNGNLEGMQHHCFYSDTVNYGPTGGSCGDSAECDTGVGTGECWEGGACGLAADCLFGCEGTCRDHCRSNADCAAGQSCNPWPMDVFTPQNFVPVCLPKYFNGTQADGTSCSSDGNCASDWCIGGICTTPCAINADCTGALAGRFCEPLSFVDSSG
ncbi:MAG: hypothetical protein HYZ27_10785, partial [Deltaproteobacteria bacterium]|nr:hypothetical protein [Deltaproteobacteria bacterium]